MGVEVGLKCRPNPLKLQYSPERFPSCDTPRSPRTILEELRSAPANSSFRRESEELCLKVPQVPCRKQTLCLSYYPWKRLLTPQLSNGAGRHIFPAHPDMSLSPAQESAKKAVQQATCALRPGAHPLPRCLGQRMPRRKNTDACLPMPQVTR